MSRKKFLRELRSRIMDLNPEDYSMRDTTTGRTVLHDAVALGQRLIVEQLLKDEVNPTLDDKMGLTALDLACIKKDDVLAMMLTEYVVTYKMSQKFFCACINRNYEKVRALVNGGQRVDAIINVT